MKAKITLAALLLLSLISARVFVQLPLVYNVENTGAACPAPSLPSLDQLPVIQPLPDPFMWGNGSGRSTNFSDWECRRNEIRAQIENYEIGTKPPRPDNLTATYTPGQNGGTLTVVVTRNGQTLTLTSQVSLPAGNGRFPAAIGMNSLSGSIPASIFTSRNIARIAFLHNQVTTYPTPQPSDAFYRLYPEYNFVNAGQYSAWAWGVSRIIDGLELVQSSLPIDLKHLGVTGCSYAGKMALFAGAFDERIALTIAQESGGGGAPSWRVSHNIEPNGSVEKIDNTDYRWFRDDMRQFSADNVYKLPEDHHELMAMVAPRALLVTGNTDYTWLSNRSAYISARAAKEVYKTFGISDRMGFYIDGSHLHCAVPNSQIPAVSAFVDKFMLGKTDVNTDTVTITPFPQLDYQRWYQWWGTENAVLPPAAPTAFLNDQTIVLDASCSGNDGAVSIIPTSGSAPFQYSMDGGTTYRNGPTMGYTFMGLAPGTYQLRLKDADGIESGVVTRQVRAAYGAPASLNDLTIVLDASCGRNDGKITLIPACGMAPFQYSIDGGRTYLSGPDAGYSFTGLAAGAYQLRLKDARGMESAVVSKTVRSLYNCNTIPTVSRSALPVVEEETAQVYPNPSSGQFRVQLQHMTGKAQVLVLNSKGAIVQQGTVIISENNTLNVDLRGKAKGLYVVKVVGSSGVKVTKVAVQ